MFLGIWVILTWLLVILCRKLWRQEALFPTVEMQQLQELDDEQLPEDDQLPEDNQLSPDADADLPPAYDETDEEPPNYESALHAELSRLLLQIELSRLLLQMQQMRNTEGPLTSGTPAEYENEA
jgi:hypothetical protein